MDLLEYLWHAFDFTITLRLQTFFFFSFPCFLEYLESNVLYLSKCSPVEYLAIFECIASLKIRLRDSLGQWEAWASDCRCKIWLLRIAWVHVTIFWKKVGRDHSQCFPDPLTLLPTCLSFSSRPTERGLPCFVCSGSHQSRSSLCSQRNGNLIGKPACDGVIKGCHQARGSEVSTEHKP